MLAMASGIVIEAACEGYGSLGCIVAIRHDVGNTVLIYAHLEPTSTQYIRERFRRAKQAGVSLWVPQGGILGKAGNSGGQSSIHLHVELRDGNTNCYVQCLPKGLGGNPIGWDDGLPLVDGYTIWGYRLDLDDPFRNYNYEGSAVKGDVTVIYNFPFLDEPTKERKTAAVVVHSSYQCNPSSRTCEDNEQQPTLTQFAGHGFLGIGQGASTSDLATTASQSAGQLISTNSPVPIPPAPTPPTTDSATFLSDVTLPDGSVVSPGQALVKTWRVRNSGTSTWDGYKLIFLQGDQMGGTSPVNIPTTSPNQEVNISVSLRAPTATGNKVGYWQIVNRDGVHVPGGRLWVNINVVSSTSGDHIAGFRADPPSPSSASTVRLYARVNWWPQFRAMRVKVDSQVIGETAAAEYTFNWNPGSASCGDHTIVLEVADQTDTAWSRPERRVLIYTLQGTPGPANHAPDRPTLERPYNWYVTIGSPPQLCANPANDPDGDPVQYYFDTHASVGSGTSGWINDRCWTPPSSLPPGTYEWRVKARDNRGAESDWSDPWHYSVESTGVEINQLYFEPLDPNQEQVRIRACTTGHAGVNISLSVRVNTATDGSENGEWRIIKELGVPCFNEVDAPVWNTLEYGDGVHRVRVVATAIEPAASDVRDELYTLNHRRPASPRLLAPIPPSGNIREAIYLNSRTVTFRWQPAIRANSYTLHIGTTPSPKDDPNPVFRQTFGSNVTEYTVTFGQDYPTLYWQVSATNDRGSNESGDQLFGIDRAAPSCTVQALPAVTYESVFQVNWGGSDNLAGIRTFDIQYLDSGRGTWSDWLTNVPASKTYELFTGQPGHTYAFRCRATDNANNTGSYPANADTSTKVDPAARPPTPWWNSAYSGKRNIVVLNNMSNVQLPAGYPVRLHFDGNTTPTAAEIYNSSRSSPKCNDLRIVYNDSTELDRVVLNCSPSAIDIWFRTQVSIPGGASNGTAHQLYYGNSSPGTPPGSLGTVFYPPVDSHTRVALYTQEGSGTIAYDSSPYHNNGTVGGGVWTSGKWGWALQYPGTNGQCINLGAPSSLNLGALTVEMWIQNDEPTWYDRFAGQLGGGGQNTGQNKWLFIHNNRRLEVSIWPAGSGSQNVATPDFLNPNDRAWHHYAFTFDGANTVRIYYDGVLRQTGTVSGPWANTNTTVEFGCSEQANRIKGRIQNMRVSDIVRTDFSYGTFAAITNEPTTAVGDPVAPPITGTPDLSVLSLAAYPNPTGGVLVQAMVRNQGNAPTQNGFFTDLYANHLPVGPGDFTGSIRYWVASPIEAGQTITLTTVITDLSGAAGLGLQSLGSTGEVSGTLYAQTDSTGAVSETDNANNISAGAEVCVAGADAYEQDDTPANAQSIALGQTQHHNHHVPGDQDWARFTAQAGVTYTIRTSGLGPAADTYLYLYGPDGTTLLAANDDYGGTLASQIEWTALAAGTYYLLVRHWNPNVGGCGTGYDLEVGHALANKVYLPSVMRNR